MSSPNHYDNLIGYTISNLFLPPAWDSYRADPPTALAVTNTLKLLMVAEEMGISVKRVRPTCVGGMAVAFESETANREVFCELYNKGTAAAAFTEIDNIHHMFTLKLTPTIDAYREFLTMVVDYLSPNPCF